MSALVLDKGQNINLTKGNAGLTGLRVGLGWDLRKTTGASFDLDAMAVCLDASGKVVNGADSLLYFRSPKNAQGKLSIFNDALIHSGDNLTGAGDGDDETMEINFAKVPANIETIIFMLCIFDAEAKQQNFGMIEKATANVYDQTGKPFEVDGKKVTVDLSEDMSSYTTVELASAYRKDGEWKFKNISQGYKEYFPKVLAKYGIN